MRKSQFLSMLGLVAAGLAGNHFKFPLFLDIDLLFGSIFAMLALQHFGLRIGTVVSALIASYTYFVWNHPYAIVILVAETAVVGLLLRRYRINLVLADTLYWLLAGMPLVYVFFHVVMDIPTDDAWLVMFKQAINGIANALLARLVYTVFLVRSGTGKIGYRDLVYSMLAFFALCPALIMLLVSSASDFADTDAAIRASLARNSQRMTTQLQVWVQNRLTTVSGLATIAQTLTPAQMQGRLDQGHDLDRNFLRIGLRDAGSTIIAYSPLVDEDGVSNVGKTFPERPYIAGIKQSLKPILTEVVMSRINAREPVVIVVAPVVRQGAFAGYVNGVLGLDEIRGFLEASAKDDTLQYTLVDRRGHVILSNRKDQQMMVRFLRSHGDFIPLGDSLMQWVPARVANVSVMARWKSSLYVSEAPLGELAPWKLILEQPIAPFQKLLYARYTDALGLLLAIIVFVLALAEILSGRMMKTTENLSVLTRNLPDAVAAGQAPAWPHSALREPSRLIDNFRRMAETLRLQYGEVKRANEALEQRVEERTQALKQNVQALRTSEQQMSIAQQISGTGSWVYDIGNGTITVSVQGQVLFGFAPVAMDYAMEDFLACAVDRDRVRATLAASIDAGQSYEDEYVIRPVDGSPPRTIHAIGRLERDAQGKPIRMLGFTQDMTERKHQEDLIRERNELLVRQKSELEATLGRIKRLEGMISICMHCKKIRTEDNDWHQLERYISEHTDALFSHGICPACLEREIASLD